MRIKRVSVRRPWCHKGPRRETDGLAYGPDRADVDAVDVLERQDTAENRGDHDEYTRAQEKTNGQLSRGAEFYLPQ